MTKRNCDEFDVTEAMVAAAVAWIKESLVLDIPQMADHPAFSRRLLQIAYDTQGAGGTAPSMENKVDRALKFLARSPVQDVPVVLTDPDFVSELLLFASIDPHAEPQSAKPVRIAIVADA